MDLNKVKKLNIPESPGCYQFLDRDGKIIYIGKAANLHDRVVSYWQKSANHSPAKSAMMKRVDRIDWLKTESEIEALLLEANLIKKFQPEFNVLLRDDKRFVYIKISTEDEAPGIFVTRKIVRAGKYFGPFVSALAVRETLKALRKIWPYCTARKVGPRPCFYHQIGRCLGVCGGVVSRAEYMQRVVRPITLFLEGKKKRIITNYELRITKREKELKKLISDDEKYEEIREELNKLKYQLANMQYVLKHTNIIGLTDKYAVDVFELTKVLGLPRVPQRIEGYDISNIFGQEAVGSMVVFSGGEPDKNEYRKFKIRIGEGKGNDVGMLKEVLTRRFAHSVILRPRAEEFRPINGNEILRSARDDSEQWPAPDLIIIDGGKAQANAADRVLKKYKLDIPVIAISKGLGLRSSMAPDKLFFPGEKQPLELPLASSALHIIKRVRDEAHRFALGYHRKLRSSKFFDK